MPLGRQGLRWVPLGPMKSTGTGRFPRCLSPPLGAPVRCSPHFIYATYSTNMMAYSLWVHSWLRVRGLVSPHLFLTCSGGGGGAGRSWSPLLRVSSTFPVTGCGACPSCCGTGARVHPFCILLRILIFDLVFILFIFILRVPALKLSLGVYALGTCDVTSDLVPLGFPSSHFQDSVLCLTCSHDSSSCSFQR